MNIEKFKLVNNGMNGIKCEGTNVLVKDGAQVFVDFTYTYKVPVPLDIVSMVQGLKYHFLVLTALLPEDSDKHFDFSLGIPRLIDLDKVKEKKSYAYVARLMEKLTITGFKHTEQLLIITAKMEGYEEGVFAVNTPVLNWPQVPMGMEEDLMEFILKIKKAVTQFIEDVKLRKMGSRQYLLDLFKENLQELERVKNLSDAEAEKEQIETLQKKGFIVFKQEDVIEEIREIRNDVENQEKEGAETQQEKEPAPVEEF